MLDGLLSRGGPRRAVWLARGIPVISTRGDSLETPFRHEESLFLWPPQNPDALVLAMCRAMSTTNLCLKLQKGPDNLLESGFQRRKR